MGETESLFVSVRPGRVPAHIDPVSRTFRANNSSATNSNLVLTNQSVQDGYSLFIIRSAIAVQSAMKIHGLRFTLKSSKNEKYPQHDHMAS